MSMPGFTAEASLANPYLRFDGRVPRGWSRRERGASSSCRPPHPARMASVKPVFNCIAYGGGIYDCFVTKYVRMCCCGSPTSLPGQSCAWTTFGCPPGHDISP
jgi:hypothetical protein